MLNTQEIANYIQSGLDEIGKDLPDPYEFSILAECGRGYDGLKVNGLVKTVLPELSAYPSTYVEAKYTYIAEFFVSGPEDIYYLTVNDIVNKFIAQNQCANVKFKNGSGVLTFAMGVPKGYKIEYELGEGVPLTFTIYVTYTENGVTSGDKHWLLDGNEIPYLTESVYVEREGITRKLFTDSYTKTVLTGQTKFYSFQIPYESTLYKSLQTEILNSETVVGTKHVLTYYDGVAFTESAPFTTTVRIYRTAKSEARRPEGSAFEVTFTDVYNSDNYGQKYYIALIDFPFDMQGDDTRYFNSTAEQVAYFEAKAQQSSAPFVEIEAPNLDSLVITKQVYGTSKSAWASQFDFVNKNYAVIKAVSAEKTYYFYYFITNSAIGADGFITVDLKLDTVQTYFFDENISFSDCLIERAHLNRFAPVEGDSTKVKFVTDPNSLIFNAEEGLNFPKRLVQRDKLKLRFTGNDEVDEWLNENVAYWVYIFIDPTKEYSVREINEKEITAKATLTDASLGKVQYPIGMNGATKCICYPIYKKGSAGIVCEVEYSRLSETVYFDISSDGKEAFEELNNESSFYYSIKVSVLPPFQSLNSFEINSNSLIIKSLDSDEAPDRTYVTYSENNYFICTRAETPPAQGDGGRPRFVRSGLFYGSNQFKTSLSVIDYLLPENEPILKTDITQIQPPSLTYNPKLNSQNFKELVITASSGDTFAYDIQKLNDSSIIFEYSEPITPEVTKYYMRVKGGTGLYEDGTGKNYMGLVGSTDNSLAYTNDQYAAFIANNKNFFLQSNMKIALNAGSGVADTAGKVAMGDYIGAYTSGLSVIKDATVSAIDRSLTIDNMKNAPDQIKNANGNVIFNMFADELGLYVEKHSALEGDLKRANDFMNLYGFTFSGIANVRNYANIRKYHNYVKAQLQSINGNLSNTARADLRQRFANGIRFWNSDTISYAYENYELWLESDKASFELWLESKKIPLSIN